MSSHSATPTASTASTASTAPVDASETDALLAARALVREALAGVPLAVEHLDGLAARAEHHGWGDVTTVVDLARLLSGRASAGDTSPRDRLLAGTSASGDPVRAVLAEALVAVLGRGSGAGSPGAEVDVLTGLPDRGGLIRTMDALDEPTRSHTGVAVVAVDVDEMKRINATYGQEVGDQVLIRVAGAIRKVVRTSDLVARWSGDEFLVVMQTDDRDAAGRRCREIAAHVRNDPWDTIAPGLAVTVSAGLAAGTVGELRQVRDDAALALDRAKARGGNRIAY